MPSRVLTEEEVRGILALTYEAAIVRFMMANPGYYPRTLALFGIVYDGTHYREVGDGE